MGLAIGQIDLGLDINQKSFNKQICSIAGGAQKSVLGAFKPLGKLIGTALGTAAVVSFTKSCLKLGSDLAEVQNVVDSTFTNMNGSVNEFAKNAMEQFGLSETVAKKYMGTLGTMSKSMGLSEQQAYDMAEAVTGLAGDVASFYNLSSDEAYDKLRSIWTGETETLKSLGVMLTQTNLDQYALNNGFGKTTKEMSEQEKLMLRYQYTMSALGVAQGDFAKTSESWANQTRVLGLRFDSLKATLGQGLINLFTPIIKHTNNLLVGLDALAQKFVSFTELITGKSAVSDASSAIASASIGAAEMSSALGAASENAKELTKQVAGFDKLNNISGDETESTSIVMSTSLGADTGQPLETSSYENSTTGMLGRLQAAFSDFKSWMDKNIKPIWKNFVSNMKPQLNIFKNTIAKIFSELPNVISAFSSFMAGPFTKALQTALSFLSSSLVTYQTLCNTVFSDLATLITPLITVFETSFVPYFTTLVETMSTILNALLETFSMMFTDIWNVVFPMIQNFVTLGLPVLYEFATEVISTFGVLFTEVKSIFDMLWNDVVNPILGFISQVWCDLMGVIKEFWDKWGKPIFENFRELIKNVGETIRNVWEEWIKPVWDRFMEVVDNLWTNHLKPFLSNFLDLVGEIVNGAMEIYNKFISPIINWLVDKLGPVVSNVFSSIVGAIGGLLGNIIDVAGGIIDVIKGIVKFISGVFTGDWKKAWEGVKGIFKGVWNALVNIIKTPINLIINVINGLIKGITAGINAVIKALNRLSFDVPDWIPGIGGKKFGFNIAELIAPQIPKLAEGGYVQANTPQLAMIGDNRHHGEIVAPEDKLQELLDKAVSNNNMNSLQMAELIAILRDILRILGLIESKEFGTQIGDQQLLSIVQRAAKNYRNKTGKEAF